MIPLRHQSHKTLTLSVTDQQALQCQVLHFSVSVWGLDIAEYIYPIHLLVPVESMSMLKGFN